LTSEQVGEANDEGHPLDREAVEDNNPFVDEMNNEEEPLAEDGDDENSTRGNKVTMLEFYSYRISRREAVFNALHHAKDLFQECLCHFYLRVEMNRLKYIERNQSMFRVEQLQGLYDHLNDLAESENLPPGTVKYLPSSFKVCIPINSLVVMQFLFFSVR
jgi:hypothetical protein